MTFGGEKHCLHGLTKEIIKTDLFALTTLYPLEFLGAIQIKKNKKRKNYEHEIKEFLVNSIANSVTFSFI